MKINLISLISFLLVANITLAQDSALKDFKSQLKATYLYSWQPDSLDSERRGSAVFFLFLSDEESYYVNRERFLHDSIMHSVNEKVTSSMQILGQMGDLPKPRSHHRIYKNRAESQVINLNSIGADDFSYEEPFGRVFWKINSETKTLGGIDLQGATGNFAGRIYRAWFAPAIPIPDGPYKFNGLPGLVVLIEDTQDYFRFELIDLKAFNETVRVIPAITPNRTTKELFRKQRNLFQTDPISYMQNLPSGGSIFFSDLADEMEARQLLMQQNQRKPNIRIELTDD